ncbi:putative flp protein [Blattamonas nauphoetae]|uniref:Flp protein n=1 Tax=Blattamonas nauphoetae TaxID=2049346 RepID=A0ABQ9WX05_9EUKA|nr:putative flp protein [Blattamonas nauphoetae]
MTRTFETLATHKFKATFRGIQHQPCRHMTSLCPDRCNHAMDVGLFDVTEYEEYTKPGQYGDEQTKVYHLPISGKISPEQNPAIVDQVRSLQPGQAVRVCYDHIYVTQDGSKFPERPCRSIELL